MRITSVKHKKGLKKGRVLWGHPWLQAADPGTSWILYPLDRARRDWWIGDRSTGLFVTEVVNDRGDHHVVGLGEYAPGTDIPKWRFEDAGDGAYYIRNEETFQYLALYGADAKYGAALQKDKDDDCRWEIEAHGSYDSPAVRDIEWAPEHPEYGVPPAQTSLDPPRMTRTPLRFIGEAVLPAPIVRDSNRAGERALSWKTEHSPYYILRRFSCWNRVAFDSYDGISAQEHSVAIEFGVNESVSNTIEQNLNVAVTADAGFAFKGVSAAVSTSVSAGLAIATTTHWERSYFRREEFKETFPANGGRPYAVAEWERRDVYSLVRAETGATRPVDEILSWEVTVPNVRISRSYNAPPPSR
ncbi:hypothetical protein ACFO4E_29575 [Nocardiopsis mangrovi]|uniref:Insecticidal crystal toxin domain-containing protein n=1 Tax=Nocardiopsis mangrovi TaxID=1179818 RepID=A0ABV9E6Y6_9ACTN